jgi:hypothetical protein
MNEKQIKGTFLIFDTPHMKMFEEIIKRTGESKIDLFKRLIKGESKRIEEGLSIPETVNSNLIQLLDQMNKTSSVLRGIADDSQATREGVNRVFSITIFLMRELYRLTHFFANVFIKSSLLLQGSKTQEIVAESNADAAQSFNTFYSTVMNTPSKEIVELLKKN